MIENVKKELYFRWMTPLVLVVFALKVLVFAGTVYAQSPPGTVPTISVTNTSFEVDEDVGNTGFVVNLRLSPAPATDVILNYSMTDGTAKKGEDYTEVAELDRSVTIMSGTTTGSFSISIENDAIFEGNENFTLTITVQSGASFSTGTSFTETITIDDDESDTGPIIDFANKPLGVFENVAGGKATLTVQLSGPSTQAISVKYYTDMYTNDSNTTADFTNILEANSETLNFAAGTTEQTIEIDIIDDSEHELNETFSIHLKDLTGGPAQFIGGTATEDYTVTIYDDDTPTIDISATSFFVAEDGGSFAGKVVVSGTFSHGFEFDFATRNGTAFLGTDYTFRRYDVRFETTTTEFSFTIPITDDSFEEGDETFDIELSNLELDNALGTGIRVQFPKSASTYSKTVTIVDDESQILSIANTNFTVREQDQAFVLNLRIAETSEVDISFDYSFTNITATRAFDFVDPPIKTGFINASETNGRFSINIVNDQVHELTETFTVTLSNLRGASFASGTTLSQTITITDDDEPVLVIPANNTPQFVAEDSTGSQFNVDIPFSKTLIKPITINFTTTSGTAVAGQDFTSLISYYFNGANSGKVPIPFQLIDDALVEGNESFTFTITSMTGAKFPDGVTSFTKTVTIVDDDSTTLRVTNTEFHIEEDDPSGNFGLNLELSSAVDMDVTLVYALDIGSAHSDDYNQIGSNIITFLPGETTKTINIEIVDDDYIEGHQSFNVHLKDLIGAKYPNGSTTEIDGEHIFVQRIKILDDNAIVLSITADTYTVAEDGGQFTFKVVTDNFTTGLARYSLTIVSNSGDNIAIRNIDYTERFSRITDHNFGPAHRAEEERVREHVFTVPIVDDTTLEGDETITIDLRIEESDGQARLPKGSLTYTKTFTIIDDESTTLSTVNTPLSIDENVADGEFDLIMGISRALPVDTVFNYSIVNESIMNGIAEKTIDYTEPTQRTVTIPAGDSTATIPIPIIDDALHEGNETFKISFADPVGAVYPSNNYTLEKTITIVDDEYPTILLPQTLSVDENESEGEIEVSVTLSGASNRIIALNYTTADGSAIMGEDYTQTQGVLEFLPGSTEESFTIPILDDTAHEGIESFDIQFATSIGSPVFQDGTMTTSKSISIVDNESPTLSIANTKFYIEEDSVTGQYNLELALSGATGQSVRLNYAVDGGTATAGTDFNSTNERVEISTGDTRYSIPIDIINDSMLEGNKTIRVTLNNLTGAVFAGGVTSISRTITIVDDESTTLSITTTDFRVDEDVTRGNFDIDVMLSAASAFDVSFTVSTEDGDAIKGQDYTEFVNRSFIIEAGNKMKTISIPIIDDSDNEGEHTFSFKIENVLGAVIVENVNYIEKTVTIVDDEVPTIFLDEFLSAGKVMEGAGAVEFDLRISPAVNELVSIRVTSSAGTASSGVDYTAPAAQTITSTSNQAEFPLPSFTIHDNSNLDGNKTFTISLTITSGAVFLGGTTQKNITMTIVDDESIYVQLTNQLFSVDESDGEFVVEYSLSIPLISDVTFDYALSNGSAPGSATKSIDYTEETDRRVTIPAGDTSGSFSIPILEDAITEGAETFTIAFSNITNAVFFGGTQTLNQIVTINESDLPTFNITNTDFTVFENAGAFVVNLSLTHASYKPVSYSVRFFDGTATAGTFYNSNITTPSIAQGSTTGSFSIPINDNVYYTTNSTFSIVVSSLSGANYPSEAYPAGGQLNILRSITIIDNEAPSMTISTTDFTVDEDVAGGVFRVNYTFPSLTDSVAFRISTSAGSATSGVDYTEKSERVLTRASGSFTIRITNDSINEGDEKFRLTIDNLEFISTIVGHGVVFTQDITIVDDETPTFSIANSEFHVLENIGSDGFGMNVELSGATDQAVSFTYSLNDGTATAGTDYTHLAAGSRSFSIPVGSTTRSFSIPILDDISVEGTESFTITISISANAKFEGGGTTKTETITIHDNELPTLSLPSTPLSVSENVTSGKIDVNVSLSVVTHQDVTFDYDMVDVSTTKGGDYLEEAVRIGTITAGQTSGTISIPIVDDLSNEGIETFTLRLSNLVGAVFADDESNISKTITIEDNELPTLIITTTDFSANEVVGNSSLMVNVKLSSVAEQDVTFDFGMTDITTTKGSDYTEADEDDREVTISEGDLTTSFSIPILNDSNNEGDESFDLILSNLAGAVFANGEATSTNTVTIHDDEPPTLLFSTTNFSVLEDVGSDGYMVEFKLSGATDEDVTFSYALSDGTATKVSDYTEPVQTQRSVTISEGNLTESISIEITNDEIIEPNENFTLTLSSLSGAVFPSSNPLSQEITIVDDDSISLSLTTSDFLVDEDVGASGFVVNVELTEASNLDITFEYALTNGTAIKGADFVEPTNRIVTIPAGNTSGSFSIRILNDLVVEGRETFSFTLSNVTGVVFADDLTTISETITILDDETSTIEVTTTNFIVAEEEENFIVNVELAEASYKDIKINYSTTDISADKGEDYTDSSGTLTILAGATTGSLSVPITDDSDFEVEQTFRISLVAHIGGEFKSTLNRVKNLTVTILDNDAPELTIYGGSWVTESDTAGSPAQAMFYIHSPVMPSATSINLKFTSVGSSFIANTAENRTRTVMFEYNATDDNYQALLPIDIVSDRSAEVNGKVTVTLNDDTLIPKYHVGTPNQAEVLVADDDAEIPELSVLENSAPVSETAGTAVFTIIASGLPGRQIQVNYTPAEVGGGDFLTDAVAQASNTQVTFQNDGNDVKGSISVNFKDNNVTGPTGRIQLTLTADTSFTNTYTVVSGDDATGTVAIYDNEAPELTIYGGNFVTESDTAGSPAQAMFTVRSPVMPAASSIDVNFNSVSSSFIADIPANRTQNLVFQHNTTEGYYWARLPIDIVSDSDIEMNDKVTVTLSNDNSPVTYYVGTPNQAEVLVADDDAPIPELSITDNPTRVLETVGEVSFTVTASEAPGRNIWVNYTPAEISPGDFLTDAVAQSTKALLEFRDDAGTSKSSITVALDDDNVAEQTGMIQVTLTADDSFVDTYTVASGDAAVATATILDNEAPEITIYAGEKVVESDTVGSPAHAEFTIHSPAMPTGGTLVVNFMSASSSFIADTIDNRTRTIAFVYDATDDNYQALLPIEIVSDSDAEVDDKVTVTLSDDNSPFSYYVGSPNQAEIFVGDDDAGIPMLTIEDIATPTFEDSVAEFTITATEDPKRPLRIRYSLADVDGDFILEQNEQTTNSPDQNFVPARDGNYMTTLSIDLDDDSITENRGDITVSLAAETDQVAFRTYQVDITSADNSAMATILDNDAPELSIQAGTDIVEADGVMANFSVIANFLPSSAQLQVRYTPLNQDFLASNVHNETTSSNLRFSYINGIVTAPLAISIISDDEVDPDGVIKVTLETDNNTAITYSVAPAPANNASVNIRDDDAPVLSIADASGEEGDGSNHGTIKFMPTIDVPAVKEIEITYSTTAGGDFPVSGDDYDSVNSVTTIPVGRTTPQNPIRIRTTADITPEPDETFILTYSAVNANVVNNTALGTISNDDGTVLAVSTKTINEGVGTINQVISLSPPVKSGGTPVNVRYFTRDGTAGGALRDNEGDYKTTNGSDSFAAGERSKSISINVTDDTIKEQDENFTLEVSTTASGITSYQSGIGTVTIKDNDTVLPVLNLVQLAGFFGEGSSTSTDTTQDILVYLNTPEGESVVAGQDITVNYAITGVEAEIPWDVLLASNAPGRASDSTGTLTIAKGRSNGTIPLVIKADIYDEINETFTITLSTPTNATIGTASITATIQDDDATPAMSIDVVSVTEGNNPTHNTNMQFTVSIDHESHQDISVAYTTTNTEIAATETGTATPSDNFATIPGDFIEQSGTLTFNKRSISEAGVITPGITSRTITIPIYGDVLDEDNETIVVMLSGVQNAILASSEITETGTIADDDDFPALNIESVKRLEGTASDGVIPFTISLSPVSGRPVTVRANTSSEAIDNATEGADYTAKSETLTFAPGETTKTFSVITKGDPVIESDEIFTVTLSNQTNATITTTAVKGTIQSDEIPAFEISNGTAVESESAISFTVTLSSGATQTEMVSYETENGNAKAGTDFIAPVDGANNLTFAPGEQSKTFTIQLVDNDFYELTETFVAKLTGNSSRTALIKNGRSTGTITDDDTFIESTISVSAVNDFVIEGQNVQFGFQAEPEIAEDLIITIALTETGDFLTIDPTTQTAVTLAANTSMTNVYTQSYNTNSKNGNYEADSTVTLTITDVSGYVVNGSANSASVVIHDAETPAGISVLAILDSVTESPSATADFLIKSNQVSRNERKINVFVDDGLASFLADSDQGEQIQTIPANTRSLLIQLPIVSDTDFEANGEISVSILASNLESSQYSPAGTHTVATITVLDDDLPSSSSDANAGISIVKIEDTVSESATVDFQITAKSATSSSRIIRVMVDDGTGDFIDHDNQQSKYNYDKTTKLFFVTLPVNSQYAMLSVELDDDSKNEDNGSITARVLADSQSQSTSYLLASSGITSTVIIEDNDPDVPILSITSAAAGTDGFGVTEGFGFKFMVRSDRMITGSALPIDFFVDDGTAQLALRIVETTELAINTEDAEYTVVMALNADIASSENVNIVISLVEHADYDTNPDQESISVKVKDNDIPSASNPIVSVTGPHYVAEGEAFDFILTASIPPSNDITVNVDVTPTQGNFLATGHDDVRTAQISSGSAIGRLNVQTTEEAAPDSDGRINAEVLDGHGYALADDEDTRNAEVVIYDELPIISITTPDSINESAGTFDITLTSNIEPLVNHPIVITSLNVNDTVGQNYDYFESIPDSIVIDHTHTDGEIIVPVTIINNDDYDGWGEITATLTNGLNYTADPNANTKRVEIVDDDTARYAVSLDAPVSVVEGEAIMAMLSVSPVLDSGDSLVVDFQAANVTGNYLQYTSVPVTITDANSSRLNVSIPTDDLAAKNFDGEINLKIVRDNGYELGTIFTKNVTILDKALLPKVSISKLHAVPIDEGEVAVFMLSAAPLPSSEILVSVEVDHTQGFAGNFLDSDDIKTHIVPVSITGAGELRIPTIADDVVDGHGSISAEILEDPKRTDPVESATYLIGETNGSESIAIADNDTIGLPSVTISGLTSINEGDMATFTLSAVDYSSNPVTVKVRMTQDGNFLTKDISTTNVFDFEIPVDGVTPGQFVISEATEADDIAEGDGSITLRVLSDPANPDSYSVGTNSSATTTVVDDDDDNLPSITIVSGSGITEGENATFTITATQVGLATSVMVRVMVSENRNFLVEAEGIKNVPVTIGTETVYQLATEDDLYDEDDGTITATILNDTDGEVDYALGAVTSANIRVLDNDQPPAMSISVASVREGNDLDFSANMVFTVTIDQESHKEIKVAYTTENTGTAVLTNDPNSIDSDFLSKTGTLTFDPRTISESRVATAGITSQTFSIPVFGDVLDEDFETLVVNLSSIQNATFAPNEMTEIGKISDDDALPELSIENAEGTEGTNSDGSMLFNISMSPISGRPVTVIVATSSNPGDNSKEGIDFTGKNETLIFNPGEDSKTFKVFTKADRDVEPDETFTVTLSNQTNAKIIKSTAKGKILSDDKPAFTIFDGMATESNRGNVTIDFTVTLSSGAVQAETVSYNTMDGSAKEYLDFIKPVEGSNTLEFATGELSKTISIQLIDNGFFELTESFTVMLSGNSDRTALIDGGVATGTIFDNDTLVESTISVSAVSGIVDEGEDVEFEFSADPEIAETLMIEFTLTETGNFLTMDSASTTEILLPANTSLTNKHIESFATKSMNGEFEADSEVTLTIADEIGYRVGRSGTNFASVIIHDANTPANISVLAVSDTIVEGVEVTADFVIKSDQVADVERKINVEIDDGPANFLANSSRGLGIQTIPADSRSYLLKIPIVSDTVFEANGKIFASIKPAGGSSDSYSLASTNTRASVTVLDNDIPSDINNTNVGISIVEIADEVFESATADFQVTAKSPSSSQRIVRVMVDDGADDFIDEASQQSVYDYDQTTKIFSVAIPPNLQYATLSVVLSDDLKNENNGIVRATVLADTNILAPSYILASSHVTASVSVFDDDPDVPILSISSAAAGIDGTGVTEGYSFKFKVRSDQINSGSPIPLDVSADDGGAMLELMIVGAKEIATNSQETELTVMMGSNADVAAVSNQNIVVTLAEHTEYDTDPERESISIIVKDNDLSSSTNPQISIAGPHYVAEGTTFNFILTASDPPSNDIIVNVDVQSTQGSFLAANQGGVRTATIPANSANGTLQVITLTETATNSDGRIIAEVLDGNGYSLVAEENSRIAGTVVLDALPEIELSAPKVVDESEGTFNITLTSSIVPVMNYPIYITTLVVDDTNGQKVDYFESIPASIMIDHTDKTIEVPVTLMTNNEYNGSGEITAILTSSTDYIADSNAYKALVKIEDDERATHTVSLDAPVSVIEGEDITVTLTASPVLTIGNLLDVDLQVTDVTGSYLNYSKIPVYITHADSSKVTINIPTREDLTRDVNGEISISIKRGFEYEIAANSTKNVTILDKAVLPAVSISSINSAPIDEGETAVFLLSTTPNPTSSITVSVDVDHTQGTTGDFLNANDIKIHEVPVPTSGQGYLRIPTISDSVVEESGSITATIKYDPKGTDRTKSATYYINENNDAISVAIADNDTDGLPSVTISGVNSIEEGETATFTLTADSMADSPLVVAVRISQIGNFLIRDLTSNNLDTVIISSEGRTSGQSVFEVQTEADAVDEENGTVSVRVLSDPELLDTYSVGEISSFTTIVEDNDDVNLTSITIFPGADINEGDDAVFTITATDVGTAVSLFVRIQIIEVGNFLTNSARVQPVQVRVGADSFLREATTDDEFDEFDGSITAKILSPSGDINYGIGSVTSASVQVTDNDNPPNMSISVESITEGNDSTSPVDMVFTVTIDQASQKEISVDYNTTDNSSAISTHDFSIQPSDFLNTSGTLTFDPISISGSESETSGAISQTFTVPIYGDIIDEDNETVFVVLTGVKNAILLTEEIIEEGTIIDNDAEPELTILPASGIEGTVSAGEVIFHWSLTPESGREVTVNYSTVEGVAISGTDFVGIEETTLRIPAGKTSGTIKVTTIKDESNEHNENFTLLLSKATNVTLQSTTILGTILNDDLDISIEKEHFPKGALNAKFYLVASAESITNLVVSYEYNYRKLDGTYVLTNWVEQTATILAGTSYVMIQPPANLSDGSLNIRLLNKAEYGLGTPIFADLSLVADEETPLVSISRLGSIRVYETMVNDTELSKARFQITAQPIPTVAKSVMIWVTQEGDFIKETLTANHRLEETVNLDSTTGIGILEIEVDDDDLDEPNGIIAAEIQSSSDYYIGDFTKSSKCDGFRR